MVKSWDFIELVATTSVVNTILIGLIHVVNGRWRWQSRGGSHVAGTRERGQINCRVSWPCVVAAKYYGSWARLSRWECCMWNFKGALGGWMIVGNRIRCWEKPPRDGQGHNLHFTPEMTNFRLIWLVSKDCSPREVQVGSVSDIFCLPCEAAPISDSRCRHKLK